MFSRSVFEISSRRSLIRRLPTHSISQRLGRREFSNASKGFPKPAPDGKPPEKSGLPMLFVGSAILGCAGLLAYQYDYLDEFIGKDQKGFIGSGKGGIDTKEPPHLGEQAVNHIGEETEKVKGQASVSSYKVDQKDETHTDLPHVESLQNVKSKDDNSNAKAEKKEETVTDLSRLEDEQKVQSETNIAHLGTASEGQSNFQEKSNVIAEDGTVAAPGKQQVENSQSTESESSVSFERLESKIAKELNEGVLASEVEIQNKVIPEDDEYKLQQPQHVTMKDGSKAASETSYEAPSLLEEYLLKERAKEEGEQAVMDAIEELNDSYITKERKLVVDFLQAIHEAEKRQHELDARAFAEEKRALKEKYEKELRDLRARELMRTEEAAMLDKEIKRERAKAATAIRSLQEKMEEKLRSELEQKENETEMKLKKVEELAKAELTAAITREKAAQIEKMAEANLHINALCMAFYARSEEARQIHSIHKLALGALALEDALSKGMPIQKELDSLNIYLEDIDKDSLLHLVLSTLPEETRHHGTDTLLQLNQKFNSLKGTLRQHILIPQGGGGISTHALAQVASWLRIKEVDPSGEGIESVISRVERFLSEGKLAEAAYALQEGVQGSKAEEMAQDWVKRARNRAITEQALTVLQSYATSISLTQ